MSKGEETKKSRNRRKESGDHEEVEEEEEMVLAMQVDDGAEEAVPSDGVMLSEEKRRKKRRKKTNKETIVDNNEEVECATQESTSTEDVLVDGCKTETTRRSKRRNRESVDEEEGLLGDASMSGENRKDRKKKKRRKHERDGFLVDHDDESALQDSTRTEDIDDCVTRGEKSKKRRRRKGLDEELMHDDVDEKASDSLDDNNNDDDDDDDSSMMMDDSLLQDSSNSGSGSRKKRVSFDTSWEQCTALRVQFQEQLRLEKAKRKVERDKKKQETLAKLSTVRDRVSTRNTKRSHKVVEEVEEVEVEGGDDERVSTSKRSRRSNKKIDKKNEEEEEKEATTSKASSTLDGSEEDGDVEEEDNFELDADDDDDFNGDDGDDDDELDLEQLGTEYELPRVKTEAVIDESLVSDAPLHLLLKKLTVPSQTDLHMLKRNGLQMLSGRFNKVENAILVRNWQRYLADYHIPNRMILFGFFGYQNRNRDVKRCYKRFSNETRLLLRLAKDLPGRTLYQVYCRSRDLLSGLKTSFTAQDREAILQLFKAHGDKYSHFCEERGYHPKWACHVVRTNLKQNGVMLKRGAWSGEEMQKLKEVVESVMKHHGLKSYDGIPWSQVARSMQRSDMQCRQRFFSKVMFLMMGEQGRQGAERWDDRLDMAKLIALLRQCPFEDESMIDWDFVKEQFSSKSFNLLLVAWRKLRLRVPDATSLPDTLDYLYENRVQQAYRNDPEKMDEIDRFVQTALANLNN